MRPARCAVFAGLCVFAAIPAARADETPLASHRFDVDGDGKLDTIKLMSPPALSIDLAGKPGAVYKPLAATGTLRGGTISAARVGGATLIALTAEMQVGSKRLSEAVGLRFARGKATTLIRVPVGPQGADGEWSKYLAATPRGLVRYQGAPHARRCDGKTAQLFPQLFDARANTFRPTHPAVDVARTATRLAATVTAPAGADASVRAIAFQSTGSSTDASSTSAEDVSAPREIEDGKVNTAWLAQNAAGGLGEFVTFQTTMPTGVRAVRVVPAPSNALNRLVRLAVVTKGGGAFVAQFPRRLELGKAYWIVFPKPLQTTCVTVIIDRVARVRGRGKRTAISELAVLTDLELTAGGPDVALAGYIAKGGSRADAAMRALRRRGHAAAGALISEIAKRKQPLQKLRLRRALASLAAPAAAAELVAGLATPGVSKPDAELFGRALARMGGPAVKHLYALLMPIKQRKPQLTIAVGALARIQSPEAAAALAELLGRGDLTWRAQVARTTGTTRPTSETAFWLSQVGVAAKAAAHEREADLWQLLSRLRDRDASVANAMDGVLLGRLDATANLAVAAGYQLRYRLFQAAAGSTDDRVLAALQRSLTGSGAHANALRRVTARALGNNPATRARAILLALAAHKDPGVRRYVAEALAGRADANAVTDRALTARLDGDFWPDVRRAAAGALAKRCQRTPIAKHLFTAMESDKSARVQRMAISALVQCRAAGLLDRLFALARNHKQPPELREFSVGAIAQLGDRSRVDDLIALFKAHRKEAWSKTYALRLAAATAEAVGRVGGKAAVTQLLKAARDDAFPAIQAGAITGLSHTCPSQAVAVFRRLSNSSQRQVSLAARRALQKCSRRP